VASGCDDATYVLGDEDEGCLLEYAEFVSAACDEPIAFGSHVNVACCCTADAQWEAR
jgi:hypothetical protein